ncbi:MAG: enolase C-terminal domain-like protein [Actinomycetota bacterium]
MTKIIATESFDVRFPTSKMLDGSDAMNQDPDYSAAYLRVKTDNPNIYGDSLVFTIGRGNDLQITAINMLAEKVHRLNVEDAFSNIGKIARDLSADSQLRWLGPDYGVFHMAAGAVLNALWDLFAKTRGVPLWKLLSDMSPEATADAIDFRYISDALSRNDALTILGKMEAQKSVNEKILLERGLPAYTTSPGWLGYSDEKMLELTKQAIKDGYGLIKYKCGRLLEDDQRRLGKVRTLVGPKFPIAIDANQVWDVNQAIDWINALQEYNLTWVEEPTSPNDVLGHSTIAREVSPTPIATGEMASSRIIFKQLLQTNAISVMQIDSTRVAGVNENLANILLAAKFSIPVCPHAGGVGLCEMVQHLAMWDAVSVTGHHDKRVVEYVSHLHDHFRDPVLIKHGSYMAPQLPGSSAEMHQKSIDYYSYPSGSFWKEGDLV